MEELPALQNELTKIDMEIRWVDWKHVTVHIIFLLDSIEMVNVRPMDMAQGPVSLTEIYFLFQALTKKYDNV